MRRSTPFVLVFFAALVVVPLFGHSAEGRADFVLPEVFPWAWEDDGETRGILVNILDAMDEALAINIHYRVRPQPRAILELRQGEADYSMLYSAPEADEAGERLVQLVEVEIPVIAARAHLPDNPPKSLDDLNGERVGFIHGTYYGEAFRHHDGIRRIGVRDMSHGLELMEQGRLTAMVGSDLTVADAIEREEIPGLEAIEILFHLEPVVGWLYRSKEADTSQTDDLLVDAIETMKADGALEAFFQPRLKSLQ